METHSYSLKLNDDEVAEIHAKYVAGATMRELADAYYCHRTTIAKVLHQFDPSRIRARGPLPGKCYAMKRKRIVRSLPNKTLFTMYKRYVDGERPRDLMREYGITRNVFYCDIRAVEKVARAAGYIVDDTPRRRRKT